MRTDRETDEESGAGGGDATGPRSAAQARQQEREREVRDRSQAKVDVGVVAEPEGQAQETARRDDLANAVAGALVLAAQPRRLPEVRARVIRVPIRSGFGW